jgi:DNA-binding FrmR family transcriptional regulator
MSNIIAVLNLIRIIKITIDEYPGWVYYAIMIEDIKKRALHRSKILQGQLRGLEKMIENEDYCIDIITQSLAIQKSLGSLNKLLLENHLRTHVAEQLASDSGNEPKMIHELLDLYELTNIRSKN